MWTEVYLEVKHGFTEGSSNVQAAAEAVPGMPEVHHAGFETLGSLSQFAETAVAVQTTLEDFLAAEEKA